MASPTRSGKLRGYSEYSLRTSVKLEKTRINLDNELTRLEEASSRKMASHRAAMRKMELDIERRHQQGTSPTQQRKMRGKEEGDKLGEESSSPSGSPKFLSASSPEFTRLARSSSYSAGSSQSGGLDVPRTFSRSRSNSGGDKMIPATSKLELPEIRVSTDLSVADRGQRRFTAPAIEASQLQKKLKKGGQKSPSPLLERRILHPSSSPPRSRSPSPPAIRVLPSSSDSPSSPDGVPVNTQRSGSVPAPAYHRQRSEAIHNSKRESGPSKLAPLGGTGLSRSFSDLRTSATEQQSSLTSSSSTKLEVKY